MYPIWIPWRKSFTDGISAYCKERGRFPDLLIVDGGYLQIEAAKEILDALEYPIDLYVVS